MRRIAGALSLAVLTTSGLVNVAMQGLGGGIGRVDAFAGLDNRPPRSAGENFLLVGTDDRDHLTRADSARYRLGGAPCHCTDTIMLAHVSTDRSRLSVLSIPRDTAVRLPAGDGHPAELAKLNSAYQRGGARLTVATVEHLTGMHVDHYVELGFASFMKTVDALGGVPVCTRQPLRDPESGLDLPAGTTVLNGGRALEYVRARYLDGTADLGRMRRQQQFFAGVVHRATSAGLLLDPVRLSDTVEDVLGSVRADTALGPDDLVHLAEAVRGLTPGSTEFASVPVADLTRRLPEGGTAVTWEAGPADRMFAALRADRPLAPHRPAVAHRVRAAGPGVRRAAAVRRAAPAALPRRPRRFRRRAGHRVLRPALGPLPPHAGHRAARRRRPARPAARRCAARRPRHRPATRRRRALHPAGPPRGARRGRGDRRRRGVPVGPAPP